MPTTGNILIDLALLFGVISLMSGILARLLEAREPRPLRPEETVVLGLVRVMNQSCKCCGAIMGSCQGGRTGDPTQCPDYCS